MSRFFAAALLATTALLPASPANAAPSDQTARPEDIVAAYNALKARDPALVSQLEKVARAKKRPPAASTVTDSPPATSAAQPAASKTRPSKYTFLYAPSAPDSSNCAGVIVALRRDMKDLGTFGGCPTPYNSEKTIGALVSFTNDRVEHNRIWTAKGLAAVLYNTEPAPNVALDTYQLEGLSLGSYVSTNLVRNSNAAKAKGNSEIYTYGGVALFSLMPPSGIGAYHNFNLSAGGQTNKVTEVSTYNARLEYAPAYGTLYFQKPLPLQVIPFALRFDPSLLVQFDRTTSSTDRLDFNNRDAAFRIGPQLALYLVPNPSADTPFAALTRLSAHSIYHWAYETVAGRRLTLWSNAVSYRLDADNHVSLSLTYDKGRDDDTGSPVNQIVLGLAARL